MRYTKLLSTLLATLVITLAGCGGGGGGGGGSSSIPAPSTNPTKATLKFSISNLPSGVKVGGLTVSFNLPSGVTPASLSGNTASSSLIFSGGIAEASFIAPKVTIGVITTTGLSGGEYATMNCSVASGTTVSSASFPTQATVESALSTGIPATSISGLQVPISVTLQ